MIKLKHKAYIPNIISSPDDNKLFGKYIYIVSKLKKQDATGITTLKSPDREAIMESSEKTNIFE